MLSMEYCWVHFAQNSGRKSIETGSEAEYQGYQEESLVMFTDLIIIEMPLIILQVCDNKKDWNHHTLGGKKKSWPLATELRLNRLALIDN